jgi:hypothetical protein
MSRRRVWLLGLGLLLSLGAATVLCQADEPKTDADKKDLTADDTDRALEEIALAYRLADAGRKAGSPEALLGAARLLSKLNGKEIGLVKLEGVKPVTGKRGDKKIKPGEPIKEDGGKPTPFVAEIQKLKADARKLNNTRNELLADLIDNVKEEVRGSFGGPKWLGPFTLPRGGLYPEHTFSFRFRANQPAHVLVRNRSGGTLYLEITAGSDYPDKDLEDNGDDELVVGRIEATSNPILEFKWIPKVTYLFTVKVVSYSAEPVEFDLFKN